MDGYSNDLAYLITFLAGGYSHEVYADSWMTARLLGETLSAKYSRVELTNQVNRECAAFYMGSLLWCDRNVDKGV